MPDTTDKNTTTGAGTTTGTGTNTVGSTTSGGPLTGGLAGNAVTSGNVSGDTTVTGTQPTGGGRAVPDFGPLASGSLSSGDTLDDAGGEDHGGLVGNQDAAAGDTQTGRMSADTAALGGGAASVSGLNSDDADAD